MEKIQEEISITKVNSFDDDDDDDGEASPAQLIQREKFRGRQKRQNVHAITVATRNTLMDWHLLKQCYAAHSWWRRERMGFDSKEKRRDGGSES